MPELHVPDAGANGLLHAGKIQSFELCVRRVEGSFIPHVLLREAIKRRTGMVHQSCSPECNGCVCDTKIKHLFSLER